MTAQTADALPVSLAQAGIWVNEALGTARTVYHLPVSVTFDGPLDVAALNTAVQRLLQRHPLLLRAVDDQSGVPTLVPVNEKVRLRLRDLTGSTDDAVDEALRAQAQQPFDLRRGPLCRFLLLKVAPERHILSVVVHHLVFDGESKAIVVRDLAAFYTEALGHETSELPATLDQADLVADEDRRVAQRMGAAQKRWSPGRPEVGFPVLPGLRRSDGLATQGAQQRFVVDEKLRSRLDSGCGDLGCSRFELILTGICALLARYGNDEPQVAIDVTTRTRETRENVGAFVNEFVVPTSIAPGTSTRHLLAQVRRELRATYPVREVPLARAVAGLRPALAQAPVLLSYTKGTRPAGFTGLRTSVDWIGFNGSARNALRLHVTDFPEGLTVAMQYDPRILTSAQVSRLGGHLTTLLAAAVESPETPVRLLDLLSDPELHDLLHTWNATGVEQPTVTTLQAAVADQANATPQRTAAIFNEDRVGFGELNSRANRLAQALRARAVGSGSLVAVCGERSVDVLVALLAVLKCGAAYLPLDPAYPRERLTFVLEDSHATLLLTQQHLAASFDVREDQIVAIDDPAVTAGQPDEDPAVATSPGSPAYVMYTSGSTGRPKGVAISHRALLNLLHAMRQSLKITGDEVYLAQTSLAFDISGLELFLPLITGGTAVLAPDAAALDADALSTLIRDHGVTHVQATPSGWRVLLDAGWSDPAVVALVGGEALPIALARRLVTSVGRLWNVYGPTETTIWSTMAQLHHPVEEISIGRPLANTQVYVLDASLRLLPVGVPGELCIGGDGVALGYLGRPALTAGRFVPNPYGTAGSRLYRTGDRVLQNEDGALRYLERLDRQVKVRGFRIELDELEAVLSADQTVAQAAVVVREDDLGDRVLIAYIVNRADCQFDAERLSRQLARSVPAFMVPTLFISIEQMPLTPNGKLDSAALPAPQWRPQSREPEATALTGLAAQVRAIFCEVLQFDDIGIDDDVFDLGGHSLTITQIAARLRRDLSVDVPLHVLFDVASVAAVVQYAEKHASTS